MEPGLIASICFNVVTTVIIMVLFCKYFQMRKYCSRGGSDFRRLEETTCSKRTLTTKNTPNNYSSTESGTEHQGVKRKESELNEVNINSQRVHSSDKIATTVQREEVEFEKETHHDDHLGDSSMVSTISNVDETNNIIDLRTAEETFKKEEDTETQMTDIKDLNTGDANKAVDKPTDETIEEKSRDGQLGVQDDAIVVAGVADDVDDELIDQSLDVVPNPQDSSTDEEMIIKPTINVQVFSRADNPIIRSAIEELMAKLVSHIDLTVNYTQVPDIAQVNPDSPLFVFCMNTSRLGTDASNAIRGMKHPSMTALLILHHQDEHALPMNRSNRMLTETQFKNMGGIFDFAFRQESGMYPCDMNTACVDELSSFVRTCLGS